MPVQLTKCELIIIIRYLAYQIFNLFVHFRENEIKNK